MARFMLVSEYDFSRYASDVLQLTQSPSPHIVYIGDNDERFAAFRNGFSAFVCYVTRLSFCEKASLSDADIVVVDTTNAAKLMRQIRKYDIDCLLSQSAKTDAVLCGVGEGGICLCDYGVSATDRMEYHRVRGLGLLSMVYCPHCLEQSQRTGWLKAVMQRTPRVTGLAVDHAAVLLSEDNYRTMSYAESARVRKCYWYKRQYYTENVKSSEWHIVSKLLCKGDCR